MNAGAVDPRPRFFCDDHLRRLGRWLRAAGYDTAWESSIDDRRMLERCRREGRALVTMHRALAAATGVTVCLVPTHDSFEQLRFVRKRFGLDLLAQAFTRCPVCNVAVEPDEGRSAPERVRSACTDFRRCPECGRIYWRGEHVVHMIERFEQASRD